MKLHKLLTLAAALAGGFIAASAPVQAGDAPLLHETFASLAGWTPNIGTLTKDGPPESPNALKITSDTADSSIFAVRKLTLAEFAGRDIIVSARIKTADISTPPQSYNGVKIQMSILRPDGKRDYPQAKIPFSHELPWTEVSFKCSVPADSSQVALRIGLEKVTGTLWVTDIKITPAP